MLAAIKQGIFTACTKVELEGLEGQRDRLRTRLAEGAEEIDKVVDLLLRAKGTL